MLEECRWAQVWAEGMEQTLLQSQEWAEQTHGWAEPLTNHPVKTSSTLATLYIPYIPHPGTQVPGAAGTFSALNTIFCAHAELLIQLV
jgi:hypothetical protein